MNVSDILAAHFAEVVYPNQCSLCGQRLIDDTTSECSNPHCPIKSTPTSIAGSGDVA